MRKNEQIPVNHGTMCDTINYTELIKRDSETPSFNEGKIDSKKIGETVERPKQRVYSRKTERNTQKGIYCGKRK